MKPNFHDDFICSTKMRPLRLLSTGLSIIQAEIEYLLRILSLSRNLLYVYKRNECSAVQYTFFTFIRITRLEMGKRKNKITTHSATGNSCFYGFLFFIARYAWAILEFPKNVFLVLDQIIFIKVLQS